MNSLKAKRNCQAGCITILVAIAVPANGQITEAEMEKLEGQLPLPSSTQVKFDEHIAPILQNSCLKCHGPERPKSRFRLDSRENALKGGANGIDIVTGKSGRSPLIFYVARLYEDIQMPPEGKGDPLTKDQVALLRAWIDQGAKWSESGTNAVRKLEFSITPSIQWFTVEGDARKFREHTGIVPGWNGGAQSIYLREQIAPNRRLTFEGHIFANPDDYKFRLEVEQQDFGFARFGAEKYREFYDDTGGYSPLLFPSSFSLDDGFYLDVGRAWAEVGFTLPNWPRMVFGYEYQYRDGTKSTLQWGQSGPAPVGAGTYNIFPASKEIDEAVHIIKFDLAHDINGVGIENNFRTEFYDNATRRHNVVFHNTTTGMTESDVILREKYDHFQAADSIRLEKQLLDWLFVSGGYHYSRLEGGYSFSNNETVEILGPIARMADSVIIEQDTHVFNANTQLSPWQGLNIYGGVQNEWMRQRGFGNVSWESGDPLIPFPAVFDSDIDKALFQEHFGLRYDKIPFTVLFAEGRLAQESIGHWENDQQPTAGIYSFVRDTDASSQLAEGRFGFTLSPWTRVSLTSHYKYRDKDSRYHHLREEMNAIPGYPAFITAREMETDEISTKLSVRPVTWLKTSLTYQLFATDFTTATKTEPGFLPGGSTQAGNYDAQVYSANVGLNPWRRVYLSSTFSFRHSRTTTYHTITPTIVPYEGDLYSSISSATFTLNDKTDLTGGYTYSWTDYGQNNIPAGLPLGLVYDWHIVSAGINRKIKKNISTNLTYRFYQYDEANMGGMNNYTAHGVFASLSMKLD